MKIKLRIGFCVCMLCLVSMSFGAVCVVSDPLNHSNGTPIAGTYSTASGSSAVALDFRALTCFYYEGWVFCNEKPGMTIVIF